MPKYFDFKVCGYYLYFTSKCIIECMHVHASDKRLSEGRLQVQIEQDLSSNYISGIHLIKKSVEQFIRSVVA